MTAAATTGFETENAALMAYINVKLSLLGFNPVPTESKSEFAGLVSTLVAQYREKERLLAAHLCPADQRIQTFLYDYLQDVSVPRLPARTLTLDRPGMARALSLPFDRTEFRSGILNSYRVKQGVLHNPRSDRRTTQGIFHVAEGGLPIPADKTAVPKEVFSRMLALAFNPSRELMPVPFTATLPQPAECLISLLIRPLVVPHVPGFTAEKRMEIRFFVPGSLVSNLDFLESIFGNAGDPNLPENDAGLDPEHWTGHTGCVILAPHLTSVTRKFAGLPHWDAASERQRREGMCWRDEKELYNNGGAFKLTCRDETGVIVTIIADNYYGYCKKEVKTQISYAANLFGLCEEEHAGGALVFPSYDLGEEFSGGLHVQARGHSFAEVSAAHGETMELRPEGYAVDRNYPNIIYVPQDARFDLHEQRIYWSEGGAGRSIKLLADKTYVRPSGYKVRLEKPGANRVWRLVGTLAEGILCHKPSTVSGGGKSEISKPITDAILTGPVFIADFKRDFDRVEELIRRDYGERFAESGRDDNRPILSRERSLGSVIKLLTPDEHDYKPEFNAWLESVPQYIKELVFVVKRFYKPGWGDRWREHFSVDIVNGRPANELKCDNRRLATTCLRVGFDADGGWRTFGLRKDFHPAVKIQYEDDITASVVVPSTAITEFCPAAADLEASPDGKTAERRGQMESPVGRPPTDLPAGVSSFKFVQNAEARLFQRPDDAIHRGYDKVTESDFARPDNFFSNYEPLSSVAARELTEDALGFGQFTEPMRQLIERAAGAGGNNYFVCSANPRLVDGKPTKNPRYLQVRPDLLAPRETYLAEMSERLRRRLPPGTPVLNPVAAVLPGRRNNPPEPGVLPLACYNPIHYFELPELFMEFICSMTGKSPSTTGAGSEGALTKGPFNALPPIIDLNNALVSFILTGHHAFVTAAGYVGPKVRVDHDVSLLVPEVWCRMSPEERAPEFLIAERCLEKCQDFEHAGRRVLASRLGYRINSRFVRTYFGRVFNHPQAVFTEEMLRPELQDLGVFADSMNNVVATQKRVAAMYFEDGSINHACPPLQALLHIMVNDTWEGKGLEHPEFRKLFSRDNLLGSGWYAERLAAKQKIDRRLWRRHVEYLDKFLKRGSHAEEAGRLGIPDRLVHARKILHEVESADYIEKLRLTLGAEPVDTYLTAQ